MYVAKSSQTHQSNRTHQGGHVIISCLFWVTIHPLGFSMPKLENGAAVANFPRYEGHSLLDRSF